MARECCPRSKLLLNEYHILEGGADLERYIGLINLLKQRRLIDGIGVQGHSLETVSDSTIKVSLDRLGKLGLPIYVSELDVNIANDNAQLRRYQTLFSCHLAEPSSSRGDIMGETAWSPG